MMKSHLWLVTALCAVTTANAETDKEWASAIGASSVEEFKSSAADTVPGYDAAYSSNINSDNIATEATIDAQTDEGAQIIYGLGGRPDVSGESWYQDAIDITQDPTSVYDMQDGQYSDCETITEPGSEYTKEQSCTETALPETASCSIGRDLEVDSHHLYECKSERDTTDGSCIVGREIDVSEAAAYRCNDGETSYAKECDAQLAITVDNYCDSGELVNGVCVIEVEDDCRFEELPYPKNEQYGVFVKVLGGNMTPGFVTDFAAYWGGVIVARANNYIDFWNQLQATDYYQGDTAEIIGTTTKSYLCKSSSETAIPPETTVSEEWVETCN